MYLLFHYLADVHFLVDNLLIMFVEPALLRAKFLAMRIKSDLEINLTVGKFRRTSYPQM